MRRSVVAAAGSSGCSSSSSDEATPRDETAPRVPRAALADDDGSPRIVVTPGATCGAGWRVVSFHTPKDPDHASYFRSLPLDDPKYRRPWPSSTGPEMVPGQQACQVGLNVVVTVVERLPANWI